MNAAGIARTVLLLLVAALVVRVLRRASGAARRRRPAPPAPRRSRRLLVRTALSAGVVARRCPWLEPPPAAGGRLVALLPDLAWPADDAAVSALATRLAAGLRLLGAAGGVLFACGLVAVAGVGALTVSVVVVAVASRMPEVVAAAAHRRRVHRAAIDLPLAIEMMAAGLDAGLPLEGALATASLHGREQLGELLARACASAATGVPAAAALHRAATRAHDPEIVHLAAGIAHRHRLGLAMVPWLHDLAEDAQHRARTAALHRAGRAGPAASVITAVVVAPACVALVAVVLLGGLLTHGVAVPAAR